MSPRVDHPAMPTLADAAVAELPLRVSSVRQRRAAEFERRGIPLAALGTQVRVVADGRAPDSGAVVFVDQDGRIYDRTAPTADPTTVTRPDLVAVDLDDDIGKLVELFAVDPDAYDLAVARYEANAERVRAEQVAAETAAAKARRAAPTQVAVVPGLGLVELLERVAAVDARLELHDDDRLLLSIPVSPYVDPQTAARLGRAVEALRPLLVASRCGEVAVACDVTDCTQTADVVGIGGVYLCVDHAR